RVYRRWGGINGVEVGYIRLRLGRVGGGGGSNRNNMVPHPGAHPNSGLPEFGIKTGRSRKHPTSVAPTLPTRGRVNARGGRRRFHLAEFDSRHLLSCDS